jgi:4-hydroxy-tetrahydrodipicolinate reductase
MIRVVVSGICGRMGGMVARRIAATDDLELVGGIEAPGHEAAGRRLRDVWGDAPVEFEVRAGLDEMEDASFDVLVDFSAPSQAVACAEWAGAAGKGLVVGTTGLTDEQAASVRGASAACAVVLAPNVSLGVNLLFGLVREASAILAQGFDVEIVEAHHKNKKDAPSGTAVRLEELVAQARGLDPAAAIRTGRAGRDALRTGREIGVHSVRGGGIAGRHAVHFISDVEEITLAHEAFSREAFALGAVRAIRYVHEQGPGLYDMSDVLGLGRRDI